MYVVTKLAKLSTGLPSKLKWSLIKREAISLGLSRVSLSPRSKEFTELHFAIWKAVIGQLLRSKT